MALPAPVGIVELHPTAQRAGVVALLPYCDPLFVTLLYEWRSLQIAEDITIAIYEQAMQEARTEYCALNG